MNRTTLIISSVVLTIALSIFVNIVSLRIAASGHFKTHMPEAALFWPDGWYPLLWPLLAVMFSSKSAIIRWAGAAFVALHFAVAAMIASSENGRHGIGYILEQEGSVKEAIMLMLCVYVLCVFLFMTLFLLTEKNCRRRPGLAKLSPRE